MSKKSGIILVFGSVLLISLIVPSILFYSYKKVNSFRLDPLEDSPGGKYTYSVKDSTIWLVGDSRAFSWSERYFNKYSIRTINTGIPSQSSKQILERFKNDIALAKPRAIIIQMGVNDLKCIGFIDNPTITRNCLNNINEVIDYCIKDSIHVVYSSIFPTAKTPILRQPIWDKSIPDSIISVNNQIKLQSKNSPYLHYFDSYKYLLDPEKDQTNLVYTKDFLHINDTAYRYLTRKLQSEFNEILTQ